MSRFVYREPPRVRHTPQRVVRPSILAREPQRVFMVVATISVALHVLAVMYGFDQPIGWVDLSAVNAPPRTVVNVRQATREQALPAWAEEGGTASASADPSVADLSLALLEEDEPAQRMEALPEQALELRPMDERMPDAAVEELAAEMPLFELPDALFEQQAGASPEELDYRSGSGLDDGGVQAGAGGGAGEAQRLLAELAGGTAAWGGVGRGDRVPGRTGPRDEAPAAVMDDRMLDISLDLPIIDYSQDVLAATTRIDVPEQLDHDFDYILTRHDFRREPGYFRLDVVAKRSLSKLQTMPKDVIFLVDTSGSVSQEWVQQISRGINQGLSTLNPQDRFNIVLFSDKAAFFRDDGPAMATDENIAAARGFLLGAKSEGWTDIHAAMSRMLVRDLEQERVYNLILISDGIPTLGVVDNRELINTITRDNDLAASIYCVGVGLAPNRELMDFLAYRNNGFCLYVTAIGRVAPTIRDLVSRLRYPLVTDVKVRVAGASVSEVYPHNLPNIHQGERFSLFGRFDEAGTFTVQITGRNGLRPVDLTVRHNLAEAAQGETQIATDWSFWKLHHLYSEIIREGATPELVRQIHELRRRYRLRTLY